ncbi:putative Cytotoxic granule associated RNA binding protein TIA1 [Blattamonas nauphoetae]|uniref:Cytotoxic granule associated RNA binding protein TIA1 n=1 Tax=Blattamonas nauphoetae TaxID=2049346 RepID=A0ABQ9XRB2_9EUKA|nr:putative Cytotoxic granule associated RNA binding protein TIA1 [Blattamonas nauphoetae]
MSSIETRIYVGSIHFAVPAEAIKALFLPFGPIRNINLQMETGSNRSKGYCFVDFVHPESAHAAIEEMNGFFFSGRQLKVNWPSGSGNAMPGQSTTPSSSAGASGSIASLVKHENTRIYVGSVPFDVPQESVRLIFEPLGRIRSIQMMPNPETGKHKGYGFIDYESPESAKIAIETMNGFEINGRQIKVNLPTTAILAQSQ